MNARHVGVVGAAMLALGLTVAPVAAQTPTKLTYFTGPTGGSWIPIGGALKVLWEKAIPGLSIENRPGAGLVNLKAVEEGKAEIGMGNMTSTVDALAGKGTGITKPYTNVCHLASLYPNVAQFVTRSDLGIKSIADIATANGVDVQTVIDTLVTEAQEHLDLAIENGRLTAAEAATKLDDLNERITARVNGERPARPAVEDADTTG